MDDDDNDNNGKAKGKDTDKNKNKNKNKNGNNGKAKGNPGGPTVKVTIDRSDDNSKTNGKNAERSNDNPKANGKNVERSNDNPKANGKNVERSNDNAGPAEVKKNRGKSNERWKTKVNVAVSGVEEGTTVPMNVSIRETEDDEAAFDAITTTVKRAGNFTMNITASPDRLAGSPEFTPGDGADSLAHIRLDHSITNDEVDNVSFMFRVSKQRLKATDTGIGEVALYRYSDDTWNALPTKPVGETETHYIFSVESPGMSEFAIAAHRPEFDLWHAEVGANAVTQSESITVNGRVTNVGAADGVFTAKLMSKSQVVDRQQITIASGGTRQVNFDRSFERPGEYDVMINDVHAGTITVEPADTSDERDASMVSVFFSRWFNSERT